MMHKVLLNDLTEFKQWKDNLKEDFFMMCENEEIPDNYPCVVSYSSEIDDDSNRDNLTYQFIYLSDFV